MVRTNERGVYVRELAAGTGPGRDDGAGLRPRPGGLETRPTAHARTRRRGRSGPDVDDHERRSLAREAATYPELDLRHVGIVDATGRGDTEVETDARLQAVSGTGDLTGISIKFSILFSALADDGIERIRSCVDSLSLLLLYKELRTIIRFTNSLSGRISATDGFGSFVLNPTMHDPRVEYTLKAVCDGALELREHDGGYQFRADGLSNQPVGWQDVDLSP